MAGRLTIGRTARLTGLPPKTIRFYEAEGLIGAPGRTDSGYRLYGEAHVERLRLIRRARQLGLGLAEVRVLLDQAYAADCSLFAEQLQATLATKRSQIEERLRELVGLRDELDAIERHLGHCCESCPPGETAAECAFCGLLLDQEGGEECSSD